MAGLKDQLLKAGLVSEQQLKKAVKEERKKVQQGPARTTDKTEQEQRLLATKAEKAQRDRALNADRQLAANKKALSAEIRQLVEAHSEPTGDSEHAFNFSDQGRVKRLYLSQSNRDKLARGLLAIVKVGKAYNLVPSEIADRIRTRDESAVVLQNPRQIDSPPQEDHDPYAAYPVPDDLMW
jgi:hypothetical protein